MGDKDEPLVGFSWKAGIERNTTGIVVWNDIFLYTDTKTGKEIGILIMDTQGLFDNDTTQLNNSRIFALTTLLSSIQVLNLFNRVQEDELQYLQFATEYARYAVNDSSDSKPFQKLIFLIRDWVSKIIFSSNIL